MNSVLSLGLPSEQAIGATFQEAEYFRFMFRLEQSGSFETVLGQLGCTILSVMKHLQGFERSEVINETWLRAYATPFATPAECLGAIAFPKCVVTGKVGLAQPPPEIIEKIRRKPALAIFGMKDKVLLPQYFLPCFTEAFPNAPVHRLWNAGHFLQEDEPEMIGRLIGQFMQLT